MAPKDVGPGRALIVCAPTVVYDKTTQILKAAIAKAKLSERQRLDAIRRLDDQPRRYEHTATDPPLSGFIAEERHRSRPLLTLQPFPQGLWT